MTDPATIARSLSEAQKQMVLASGPGGWGSDDTAFGVEIQGSQYQVARKLESIGLGDYTYGSPYGDLYFNNETGLAVRAILQGGAK